MSLERNLFVDNVDVTVDVSEVLHRDPLEICSGIECGDEDVKYILPF